jgi:hypothetical protein
MALYWDKISAIVPFEFYHHPEKLTPFMRELLSNGLVQPIIPTEYISIDHPPRSGTKFFATASLQKLRDDINWLSRTSDVGVGFSAIEARFNSMALSYCLAVLYNPPTKSLYTSRGSQAVPHTVYIPPRLHSADPSQPKLWPGSGLATMLVKICAPVAQMDRAAVS